MDRLAQAIGMLEDLDDDLSYFIGELRSQGAIDPGEKRDIYRHKKTMAYRGQTAVRQEEEAERVAQNHYDDLKPIYDKIKPLMMVLTNLHQKE